MTEKTTKTKEEKPLEEVKETPLEKEVEKNDRYYEAVGRRKSATARVRIFTKGEGIIVNDKECKEYFALEELDELVQAPLKKMKSLDRFKVTVKVKGGGVRGQAEAVRHALSRALIVFNADFKKRLKRAGFLKRDPRVKERKKYGLKKARKSPRWSKR
jgi:small subunit ribosomal protein S9